ncbi:MAG: hypothetical protein IKM73_00470 [Acidaminococcaceae bacterium]|nr:hypothetical protein [Acidaminococcaceae bacterium]
MPIEGSDYYVYVMQFHIPVPTCCRVNSDGTYSLYLNSDYDRDHWIDGYEHELLHMMNDDFSGDRNIMDIEKQL